jgi:hypothetical protein
MTMEDYCSMTISWIGCAPPGARSTLVPGEGGVIIQEASILDDPDMLVWPEVQIGK